MERQKTVLVTGANRGIGFEVARQLAKRGWRVFAGIRNHARAEAALTKWRAEGLAVEVIELDVSDRRNIEAAAQTLAAETGALDVLVNNAGVYLDQNTRGIDADPEVVIQTLQINTLGPLLLTRALLPLLEKSGAAQVINLSSGMGQLTDMNGWAAGYRISKVSLNAVTRMLAEELKEQHISVNSVCPGWVKTGMGGASAPRSAEQGADTVVWLASGEVSASGGFFRDRKSIPW